MKKIFVCLSLFAIAISSAHGQLFQNNFDQIAAIGVGNASIDGAVKGQTGKLQKMAVMQGAMYGEFTKIAEWEGKYNSYLKTTRGYAESLKAGTMLYLDGMRTIQCIIEVKKAVVANPEGIAASGLMTNVYAETAAQFVKAYKRIQEVAKGGKENMLNGAERNEMLWNLVEEMDGLNRELHQLAISIAYYNMMDVWRMATAGFTQKDHGLIAQEALDRWQRAQRVNVILNQ